MPRKATKAAAAAASPSGSFSKRSAPESPIRQSKRARAAARKSYVEPETDTDEAVDNKKGGRSTTKDESDAVASDFDDVDDEEVSSESEQDDTASEEETAPKKATPRSRSGKEKTIPIHTKSDDEGWRDGAKLEPGTRLVIKKPKAREAGDTPYLDDTVHPNTMLFLKDLAANNDRQWLKLHDPDYRAAFQDFSTFTEKVSEKVMEADETIPELPVKDVIYRIYRDVRFSKDQTPYKTYFSAAWSRTGRKGPYAHYYVQIQPNGGSFVGGGYWQPDAAALSKLRRDIDRKPHKIKAILTNPGIRKAFLGGVSSDEKKAVKAFTHLTSNQSTALKRQPKGYDHDHRDIELLRLRNFTIGTKLLDKEVVGAGGLDRVAELIECMVPFICYLNSVAMPDEESSGSDDEAEADESAEGSALDDEAA